MYLFFMYHLGRKNLFVNVHYRSFCTVPPIIGQTWVHEWPRCTWRALWRRWARWPLCIGRALLYLKPWSFHRGPYGYRALHCHSTRSPQSPHRDRYNNKFGMMKNLKPYDRKEKMSGKWTILKISETETLDAKNVKTLVNIKLNVQVSSKEKIRNF